MAEALVLYGAAAVLMAIVTALGFNIANDEKGTATINKMAEDLAKAVVPGVKIIAGTVAAGLSPNLLYLYMQVVNGKTSVPQNLISWVNQWLNDNKIYSTGEVITPSYTLGSIVKFSDVPKETILSFIGSKIPEGVYYIQDLINHYNIDLTNKKYKMSVNRWDKGRKYNIFVFVYTDIGDTVKVNNMKTGSTSVLNPSQVPQAKGFNAVYYINYIRNNKNEYQAIMAPVELQFENTDKLFSAFEVHMENNDYQSVDKIIKALDTIVGNLELVIEEAPSIILMSTKLIPKRMKDVYIEAEKLRKQGYNLDYLNIEYNCEEANKKITDIMERLNVLNIEDSTVELKTIMDYFDGLYHDFDKEKIARKIFEDYIRTILVKTNKFERINNDLIRKAKDFKYSYDLKDEDFKILDVLKEDLKGIKHDYDEIICAHRSKSFAYSRLAKEMEELNVRLSKVEEKLDYALKNLGSLKEDEVRAREQLDEIKEILIKAKSKINSYKLPVVPKKYYVELAEATNAIKEMIKELERQPISIKTLNIRVDTARDLVLKLYNTSKEIVKTCYLAEMSVVYGNRYRTTSSKVDAGLTRAEMLFEKGNFKASLENSINAISTIEPDFYHDLLSTFEK